MNHVEKVSSRVFSVVVFTSKVATSNVRRTVQTRNSIQCRGTEGNAI